MIDFDTPCREWQGSLYPNGYGQRYLRGSVPYRSVLVHRWIWEQVHGPIPAGAVVMHTCDNRACFRLDHLRLGTQAANIRDMVVKGRGRRTDTYTRAEMCVHGHPYPESAYFDSHGWPHCRACDAERHRAARRRQ